MWKTGISELLSEGIYLPDITELFVTGLFKSIGIQVAHVL